MQSPTQYKHMETKNLKAKYNIKWHDRTVGFFNIKDISSILSILQTLLPNL